MHPYTLSMLLALCVASPREATIQSVEFLGFSKAETAYAYRLHYARGLDDGQQDSFSLIEVRDTEHGAPVALFRDGGVVRRNRAGQIRGRGTAALLAANPEWGRAAAPAIWQRLRAQGHFHATRHAFGDGMVRLLADNDAHLTVTVVAKSAHISGPAGEPLGYTPMARTLEGHQMPLGHFRHEADAGTVINAQLQVYHSSSGRLIAVINRFLPESGGAPSVQTLMVNSGRDPIASTRLHPLRLVDWQAHSLRDSFKKLHPGGMEHFDTFVGTEP